MHKVALHVLNIREISSMMVMSSGFDETASLFFFGRKEGTELSVPRSVLVAAAVVALVSRFYWTGRVWGWDLKLSDRLDSPDGLAIRRWER